MLLLGVRAEAARRVVLPVFLVDFLSIMAWTPSLRRGKSNSGLDVQDFASFRGARQTGRSGAPSGIESRRLVTVADAIQMTRIAGRNAINTYSGSLGKDFVSFSPDGKRLVLLVKKGNLEQNTNDYSMLLYRVGDLFASPEPRTLVSFASSSNRAAIDDVTWMEDSETILFLGEQPGETTQLYSVECTSGRIRRLTNHPTNLLGYSTSTHAERLAYLAERPLTELVDESASRSGYHVSDEELSDLIAGHLHDRRADVLATSEKGDAAARLQIPDMMEESPLFVSPDGRYLVLRTLVPTVPAIWHEYKDGLLQLVMHQRLPSGIPSQVQRYTLVDLQSGRNQVLLDSPVSYYGSEVKWLADSRSVVVAGVYLPLDVPDRLEQGSRERSAYVVEVEVPSLAVSTIAERDLELVDWNAQARILRLKERGPNPAASKRVEYYEKEKDAWKHVTTAPENSGFAAPDVLIEQDLNTSPHVIVVDPRTGHQATLLELNPQFRDLTFGNVESIRWIGGGDHEVEGGLYLPPGYTPGKKYPLVIQTHGFDPHSFWVDGPFSTAFAAQPLAAKGIMVLQVPDSHDWNVRGTPREAPFMMKTYEKAIDYLDRKGMIDRNRIGLIGFSQTCLYVQYMLTHSKYPVAAAAVADGIDGGYFQYIAFASGSPYLDSIRENTIGTPPFGAGLKVWLKRSPGFLLDRVNTPLLIQAIRPPSLLEEWEWFAGLSRLNKPVDFVYLPSGYHILQKPRDRMVSQQGDVDWFCFWLKGEEDSDPAKDGQYSRWSRLRDLARQNQGSGLRTDQKRGD